jgi:histidinol phosphatase-like PHP family hydrolase
MTGRLLLRRPGYDIDIEKVLAACAEHGVAVEINANPWRLDLDWRWHEMALKLGCLMSINPDAHSTRELDLTHWGVEMARKAEYRKTGFSIASERMSLPRIWRKGATGGGSDAFRFTAEALVRGLPPPALRSRPMCKNRKVAVR